MFRTKGTGYSIEYKNPWGDRLIFLEKYLPNGKTVVDFGCGNKEILDYFSPSTYLGIDIDNPLADMQHDLNYNLDLKDRYEYGLIIGVLEYLVDPDKTLNNIKNYADNFLILVSVAPKKDQWKNSFTKESIETLVKRHFNEVEIQEYHRYVLCIAKQQK